jgi:hypothetical protein
MQAAFGCRPQNKKAPDPGSTADAASEQGSGRSVRIDTGIAVHFTRAREQLSARKFRTRRVARPPVGDDATRRRLRRPHRAYPLALAGFG